MGGRLNTYLAAGSYAVSLLWIVSAGAAPPAPSARLTPQLKTIATSVAADRATPLVNLSDAALAAALRGAQLEAASAEGAAQQDIRNRFHRLSYERYREVEASLLTAGRALEEMRRRESDLVRRIRVGRRIDQLQARIRVVRRMLGLLRLYTRVDG